MTDLVEIVARAIGDSAEGMHISQLRLAAQAAIAAARPVIEAEYTQLIRNLRETGDRLAGYSGHDRECAINSATPSVCNCGYTTIINAWKELGS